MIVRSPRLSPLLAALLALFSQIAFATLPANPPPAGPAALSLHICGAATPDAGHTAPHHGGLACQLCPLCFAATASALLPTPMPVAALLPRLVGPAYQNLFEARAPPGRSHGTAYPRGPPVQA